jgi:SSS family solute:Na+ symporter
MMGGADWAMVVFYMLLVLAVGLGSGFRIPCGNQGKGDGSREDGKDDERDVASEDAREEGREEEGVRGKGDVGQASAEDFFLAGRQTSWWAVGFSLFASNIGSEHFVGLAGSGAQVGLCVAWGEWLSPLCILLLGWLLVPYYLRTEIYTMPEFLERRYSKALRVYYAVLLLIMYVLTKVSVTLYSGAIVFQQLLGVNLHTGAGMLVAATGVYATLGGMKAVIRTEVLQAIVLIIGGVAMAHYSLDAVQGWQGLSRSLPDEKLHLFQPMTHAQFPWTGVFFGMPYTSIWYWCTDQNVVQRVLSARSLSEARAGTILAGYLKILPPFIMVLPGMVAQALYAEEMAAAAQARILTKLLSMVTLHTANTLGH